MSFNHDEHYLDEKGFQRHKETHHLIGIEGAPPAKHPDEGSEFPKWVVPHHHHVHQRGEHISTPHFPQFHINRNGGEVTVLVHTPEEEKHALSDPHAPQLLGQ